MADQADIVLLLRPRLGELMRSAVTGFRAAVTDRIWSDVLAQWESLGGVAPLRRASAPLPVAAASRPVTPQERVRVA